MDNISIEKIRNTSEFEAIFDAAYLDRVAVEKMMALSNRKQRTWHLPGYCEVCGKAVRFLIDWVNSFETPEGKMPSYRERIICEDCGLNNRQRFMAAFLRKAMNKLDGNDHRVYLYEQVTQFFKLMQAAKTKAEIFGSEYLGHDKKPGELIKNIRHEDALSLSMASDSIDIIVSNDVYEHVPDISTALAEACRVLKKGGRLLFSVPFHASQDTTTQRARLDQGVVTHLLPERYHGNPVSFKGSLVFYDFGWDLLDFCRAAGFSDVYMLCYYSMMYGYIGEGMQYMFVAEK
ncbi:MAG: class I SAM-dependent methyltransferase [Deltaproteobacteria bacterium HGW-Deltaproteobacteria-4]|nr:MAG: class I SAM-dependent methyltransferase [Deltaproteobacteria bacterium HGW-Deltaproteobacteria-4]